ncbi:MAG: Uma2 family endonuclease [Myxococcota bacterium]
MARAILTVVPPVAKPIFVNPTAEPAWDIARLFPDQGSWSEEEYLALSGSCLVEFSHGSVEVLPMPTDSHQAMVAFLYTALLAFVSGDRGQRLGTVRFAPLRLCLWPGKFREPDLLFLRSERDHLRSDRFWSGADLVMEVVSTDDRDRDLVVKRREYARAGIDEYWIVDPHLAHITVLRRDGERYLEHGVFDAEQRAESAVLPGFAVVVSAVLSAG